MQSPSSPKKQHTQEDLGMSVGDTDTRELNKLTRIIIAKITTEGEIFIETFVNQFS